MVKKLTLFNNKGGVGKTTLTINIAAAMADQGKRILLVDADPQCNLTSFYLTEKDLDALLGESDDSEGGGTIWSCVKPVVLCRGGIRTIDPIEVAENIYLIPGDVLLTGYEEELPAAWTSSFARQLRGYDLMCAIADVTVDSHGISPRISRSFSP